MPARAKVGLSPVRFVGESRVAFVDRAIWRRGDAPAGIRTDEELADVAQARDDDPRGIVQK